jgi:hypothetical protein
MLQVYFKEHDLDREKFTALVNHTVSLLNPKSSGDDQKQADINLAKLYRLLIEPVKKWLQKPRIIVIPHEVMSEHYYQNSTNFTEPPCC